MVVLVLRSFHGWSFRVNLDLVGEESVCRRFPFSFVESVFSNVEDLYEELRQRLTMAKFAVIFVFVAVVYCKMSSLLSSVTSTSKIQERINSRYDDLFRENSSGERAAHVCCICDELFISKNDIKVISVAKLKAGRKALLWDTHPDPRRPKELEEMYQWSGDTKGLQGDLSFLKGMALSPRAGTYKASNHGNSKTGFASCSRCKSAIDQKNLPSFAIVNKNYVGNAPVCLQELTQVELALLSPVKNHGYCFTWEGGIQMKGTLTFLRVAKRGIARAITQLQSMGFTKNILVLYKGKFTKRQKEKAVEQSQVRMDKVIAALEWLVKNNNEWKNVNLQKLKDDLSGVTPVVVDNSDEVESESMNVQEEDLFTCYYPEGAATAMAGGFDEAGAFKTFVEEQQRNGFDVEFKMNLEKEFVKGNDSDILLNGCLLQFPYGIGALNEDRKDSKGDYKEKTDLCEHLRHLSLLSLPEFHAPLFQLVMYSLVSKFRLLRMSRLQLRNPMDAKSFAEGINAKDVSSAIQGRRSGNYNAGTRISRKLLESVDACTKELPHSNEASKKARSIGEAMQHHFGMASIFLTVVFDDQNSFLMQVLSGVNVDDGVDVDSLTDEQLSERAKERKSIRIEYPGIAALNFEMLYRIVIEEVIGWDAVNHKPTEKPGFFGECYAFCGAIEEQGRKTLHSHMTIWITGYKELTKSIFFGKKRAKESATQRIQEYYDTISTTELFPTQKYEILEAFDHDCEIKTFRHRGVPVVVTDQGLRNLRHKMGYKALNGVFATCPDCPKSWTYEDMVSDYMRQGEGLICPKTEEEAVKDEFLTTAQAKKRSQQRIPKARMFGKILEFQRTKGASVADTPKACINGAYQHHLSCHVAGCFKCMKKGAKKSAHVCGPKCECRYRLPDCQRSRSRVTREHEGVNWYEWTGVEVKQPLLLMQARRGAYDLCQNICCTAISQSKLSCNSNIALIMDGPVGQYQHKYQQKANQDEESHDYKRIEDDVRKLNGRVHEEDRPEALRIICRAAFAQNRNNVISPPFASYLTRHDSRFYYSHEFIWCPLKDVVRLHNKQDINGVLKLSDKGPSFFESAALNYLCRSKELERVCLKDFTEQYYSTYVPKDNDDDEVLPYMSDTGFFKHPSVIASGTNKGKCRQGVGVRLLRGYIKLAQWMFPDTADFKSSIIDCHVSVINKKMEVYSQVVMSLLLPHRSSEDLQIPGNHPYTMKLRETYTREMRDRKRGKPPKVFTDAHMAFLQNVQDCRANSLRYKLKGDELERRTVPYQNELPDSDDEAGDDDDDDDDDNDDMAYEAFMDQLTTEHVPPSTDEDPSFLGASMRNFKFTKIRNRGKSECGFADWFQPADYIPSSEPFLKLHTLPTAKRSVNETFRKATRTAYTVDQIVKVLLRRITTRTSVPVWKDKNVDVTPAIGSVKSIREWSKAALGSDRKQQRAFEAITAAFVLSFYDESPEYRNDATTEAGATRSKFRQSKKALRRLKGNQTEDQLICLLHGPGGSGKSTVINLVQAYAKGFCAQIGHTYTPRTIVITAMSGVAATLIHGETTHSAVKMNSSASSIPQKYIDTWADARLIIIDEISFASPADIQLIYERLKLLMMENFKHYGGCNVVFAGDYSQLIPVNKPTVYDGDEIAEFHGLINSFIELDGTHRFKNDPPWGQRLLRFREGEPTLNDIHTINDSCHLDVKFPPSPIQVATHTNKDRDAVNCGFFEEYCQHNRPADDTLFEGATVILMDNLQMQTSGKSYTPVKSNLVKRHFYENCSEDTCNFGKNVRQRVDPVLKLYPGCPMMLTDNTDVPNGQANGSRVFVRHVKVKTGEQAFPLKLDCGTVINALFASQVECIQVQHENDDILPPIFDIAAQQFTFKTKMEVGSEELVTKMGGHQFPLISNTCTTGHKLQGCTVSKLLCNAWNYTGNWAYVVLSRVKEMKGLYIRHRLTTDLRKYKMPQNMKDMLSAFKQKCALSELTDEDYDELCVDTDFHIHAPRASQQSN